MNNSSNRQNLDILPRKKTILNKRMAKEKEIIALLQQDSKTLIQVISSLQYTSQSIALASITLDQLVHKHLRNIENNSEDTAALQNSSNFKIAYSLYKKTFNEASQEITATQHGIKLIEKMQKFANTCAEIIDLPSFTSEQINKIEKKHVDLLNEKHLLDNFIRQINPIKIADDLKKQYSQCESMYSQGLEKIKIALYHASNPYNLWTTKRWDQHELLAHLQPAEKDENCNKSYQYQR